MLLKTALSRPTVGAAFQMFSLPMHRERRVAAWQHAASLTVAAGVGATVVAPLSLIKNVLQAGEHARPISAASASALAASSVSPSEWKAGRFAPQGAGEVVASVMGKSGGVSSLWRGHTGTLARLLPLVGVQSLLFSSLSLRVVDPVTGYVPPVDYVLAGGYAAFAARALAHPLDMLRLRMMVDPVRHGSLFSARTAVWGEGARAVLNGSTTLLVDTIPYALIAGHVYGYSLALLAQNEGTPGMGATIGASAAAAFVAESILYPVETMRRRLQAQEIKPMPDLAVDPMDDPKPKPEPKVEVAKAAEGAAEGSVEKEAVKIVEGAAAEIEGVFSGMRQFGFRAMFRGILISWARICPMVIASALVYNQAESFWVYYNGYTSSPFDSSSVLEDVDQSKPAGNPLFHPPTITQVPDSVFGRFGLNISL